MSGEAGRLVARGGWCVGGLNAFVCGSVEPIEPCNGVHRWERWASTSQCGCAQCGSDVSRRLECEACPETIREDDPGFAQLWEITPWA